MIFLNNPNKIVEFGILDGYSLNIMANNIYKSCTIDAYDLFDDFDGNHSNYEYILNKFKDFQNVNICKGDFYNLVDNFEDHSIDIIHIDIANNGYTYEFAIKNYIKKLNKNGIMILEGGSKERDNIEWMTKYNKDKIKPIIEKYKAKYNIYTLNQFPSITIIKTLDQ